MTTTEMPFTGGQASDARTDERWPTTFAGVVLAVWCTFASFGIAIPLVPRVAARAGSGSPFVVGVAFAVTAAVAFAARPVAGQLAQRHGSRRVMSVGGVVAALGAASYLLPVGVTGLMLTRAAVGVAEAAVMTAGSVWAVSLAPAHRRGRVISWYGLSMWGGLAAGPVIGEALLGLATETVAWAVAAALPVVSLAVLCLLPRSVPDGPTASSRLLPRAAVRPGLALAAGGFGFAVITSFGALAMADRGIGGGALLVSAFSAAYVAVRLLGAGLPDRIGPRPVILAAGPVEAVGLAVVLVAPSLPLAVTGALVAGGGFTLLYPALALAAVEAAPESERGATLGAISSFLDLSVTTAGLVGGVVAGLGYSVVLGLSVVLALVAVVGASGRVVVHRQPDDDQGDAEQVTPRRHLTEDDEPHRGSCRR